MDYLTLAYLHLATIVPCFLVGAWLLTRRKGTPIHQLLGKIYAVLILFSSGIALAMPADIGPRILDHFGFIHLFCVLVLVLIPLAIRAILRGDARRHGRYMLGVYLGGILIAGTFAFMPGRLLPGWLFG